MNIVEIAINSKSEQEYIFKDEKQEINSLLPVSIHPIDTYGLSIISSRHIRSSSLPILSEIAPICIPVGSNRNRICFNCKKLIEQKAKTYENLAYFLFCSLECLNQQNDFTEHLYDFLLELTYSMNDVVKEDVDIWIFIIYLLFHSSQNIYTALQVNQIFTLYESDIFITFEYKSLPFILNLAKKYDVTYLLSVENIQLKKLYRIIYFNTQKMSFPGLPQTFLMTILPTLSRINHSCSPNSILTFSYMQNSIQIQINVKATSNISCTEQISMSYITQLGQSYKVRQELLRNAFGFQCKCTRCTAESNQQYRNESGSPFTQYTNILEVNSSTKIDASDIQSLLLLLDQQSNCSDSSPYFYECFHTALLLLNYLKTNWKDLSALQQYWPFLVKVVHIISDMYTNIGCSIHNDRLDYLVFGSTAYFSYVQKWGGNKPNIECLKIGECMLDEALRVTDFIAAAQSNDGRSELALSPYQKLLSKLCKMKSDCLAIVSRVRSK